LRIQALLQAGQGKEARDLIDARLREERDPAGIANLHQMRAIADMLLNDREGFKADADRALAASPNPARSLQAFVEMAVFFDPDIALSSFKRLSAIDKDRARRLDERVVGGLLQVFFQAGKIPQFEELTLLLGDLSYGGALSRDDIQIKSATILMKRGRPAEALDHARQVRNRSGLIDILTDRRFEAIWPELERSVGPRMETVAQANLASARAAFEKDPDKIEARLALMQAMADLGMWADADSLGKAIGRNRDELLALNERTAWIVDNHADILAAADRMDEADQRRAALVDTWTDDRGWIVNMAINRVGALVSAQRYQKALALLDSEKPKLDRFSSAYAKQLLRGYRIRLLVSLGRLKEANAIEPELIEHSGDATEATLGALLYLNRDADAEKLAVKWLDDPDKASSVISFLRTIDDPSSEEEKLEASLTARLRARPAIAAAFAARARDLPPSLRRQF
jgi:hypothetical protein